MKKKWLVLGSAIGISSVVMVATGISAMAGTSGYDAYKSALKNTKTVSSVAIQAEAQLQDNGKVLVDASGSAKVNVSAKTASGSADVTADGTKQSLSFYKQAGGAVLKSSASDVFYVKTQNAKEKRSKPKDDASEQQMSQQAETVIDALVGNLKDYVAVNDQTDGSKEISVQLDNSQLPAVVNAIAPIAIKQATKEHKNENRNSGEQAGEFPFQENVIKSAVPQLTQDIKIEKVAVKANINASNYIDHQEADLTVSGKDDSGAAHQVTLHLQADLSGYNSTTPDTIDLTGKNVQQIKRDIGKHHGENG
ncbi:hypothetical protein SD70_14595 [Gordoniibacillus kamchatkensis]|uniref:Uncharacterized protein n=1 Tax=Gordoniibacillus kamchatkensis TaxID=1590651 RepID=A0ABR5AH03_9BACL|nr:hypothetical protein [Paenibacillus sp. VKM B-2647]KIL40309.1 hypothetical protein SD70_14595 [Paenibacillus sp. VKM B-2647]